MAHEDFDLWARGLTGRAADLLSEMLSDSEGCGRCGGDGSVYDGAAEEWRDCPTCQRTGQEPHDYEGMRKIVQRFVAEGAR